MDETKLKENFGERVVTLAGNRPGLRAQIHTETRLPDDLEGDTQPVVDFTASDATLDRYDEVIEAAGWDLGNYQRNPVFQNSHQYGDIIFTIGRALITEVRGSRLFQRVLFAVNENPFAKIAYDLYRGKFLNAVSVGFIPLEWVNGGQDTDWRRKFIRQELLENSAVSIPANPNALANAVKSGAVEKSDLRELTQLLTKICNTAGPGSDPTPRGSGADGGELLRLAREVRDIMRKS